MKPDVASQNVPDASPYVDMCPAAIDRRLRMVSQLRNLCVELARAGNQHPDIAAHNGAAKR